MSVISMRKLLEAGVHFGHQTRRWNPKMKPNIYAKRNGVYIINLEKTIEQIDTAYAEIKSIAERGGKVLFVGTKKQAQASIVEEALRSGSFFVNQRWLGGLLTNYRTIQKRVKRLMEIEEMEASGLIDVYPKKEIAQLRKQKSRLENFLGGIKEMKKLPNAVFVIDPKEEHNAVAEARKLGIPVFAMIDTNCDPETVDFPIASNDDAIRSVKLVTTLIADAIVEAKGGLLTVAHSDENEKDVTMADVIINVEEQIAENEKRRRQRNEERRNRRPFDRNKGPRREFRPYGGNNDSRPDYKNNDNKSAAPRSDASKVEAPKVAAQKVEAPKVETPKVEAPKVEAPKVEAPKVKEVKAVATKVKAVKEEAVVKEKASVKKAAVKKVDGEVKEAKKPAAKAKKAVKE